MLQIIGEALLIATRMDRACAGQRDRQRPEREADAGARERIGPRRLPGAGA